MDVVEYMEAGDYEQLVVCTDREVGLRAFIAIHDTTLGTALGGCRIWPHPSEKAAVTDVLRLARAMTYKNAAAGLHLGGGKALIWADSRRDKSEAMLRAFGRFVDTVGGRYITTEDVGTSTEDMVTIRQETSHVVGLPTTLGGSGDPSKATGFGVYQGIKACSKEALGTDSLKDVTIALQGFGKVASHLAGHLKKEKARVVVTDINEEALKRAAGYGFTVVEDPEAIYDVPCDIFAPCALGGTLNKDTIPRLQCRVVAGAANNQLLTEEDGEALHQRDILYAPDYVINAGGVINLSFEIGVPYREEDAMERVARIHDSAAQVIEVSKSQGVSTNMAAARIAEERIQSVRRVKGMHRGRDQRGR